MENRKFEIHIARSSIGGTSVWLADFLIIVFIYVMWALLIPVFTSFASRYIPFLTDWADFLALVVVVVLAEAVFGGDFWLKLESKMGGRSQRLEVCMLENQVQIVQGRWKWMIPYAEIEEVGKIMVINSRIYTEKGKYKVKIKRKGHRGLVFLSTWEEYNEHLDFEDTELSMLYYGFKGHGVKCC